MTTTTIEGQLMEAQRDALVDFYLGQVVPKDASLKNYRQKLKTVDDLFEFLLIDSQFSQKVSTSRVSQSISSVQQYISRIMMHLEKGLSPTQDEVENWEDNGSRFSHWSANQQLGMHPDIWIDPTLRKNKTHLFDQLESTLNQGRITDDTVQQAFLQYLGQFEEISNLEVVGGYEDGIEPGKDMFYLLGRTRSTPYQYFWRTLDMSDRQEDGALYPTAWSSWVKIDVPLSKAEKNTVKLVRFNTRLYVVWGEVEDKAAVAGNRVFDKLLSLSYLKYDGSWSPPEVVIRQQNRHEGWDPEVKNPDGMIAVVNSVLGKERLTLSLFSATKFMLSNYDADYVYFEGDEFLAHNANYNKTSVDIMMWFYVKEQKVAFTQLIQYPATRETRWLIAEPAVKVGTWPPAPFDITFTPTYSGSDQISLTAVCNTTGLSSRDGKFGIWKREIKNGVTTDQLLDEAFVNFPGVATLTYPNFKIDGEQRWVFVTGFNSPAPRMSQQISIGVVLRAPIRIVRRSSGVQVLESMEAQFQPIRLNSLFAKELTARASSGASKVLSWETQNLPEPSVLEYGSDVPLDLSGANSLYFWELFFHTPFLVAWRLNSEQRYKEASQWLHYIFNPLEDIEASAGLNKPLYWCSRPVIDPPGKRSLAPNDPDDKAARAPVHYRKAIYHLYLKNTIDEGDYEYRQLTPTSRTSARLSYASAQSLLGPRPDMALSSNWQPVMLEDAAQHHNDELRAMESFSRELPLVSANEDTTLRMLDNSLFRVPLNRSLMRLWDVTEHRIHNLRNFLTLDGKPLSTQLFDDPVNPRSLLKERYQRAQGGRRGNMTPLVAPQYRYAVMYNKAQAGVDSLIQFGQSLLSLNERKDSFDIEGLRLSLDLNLFDYALKLQQLNEEVLYGGITVLQRGLESVEQRYKHYLTLYEEYISPKEIEVMSWRADSATKSITASAFHTAAAVADLVPNIFGLAVGGMRFGGPFTAVALGIQIASHVMDVTANRLSEMEMYRRRRQDWEIQYKQAEQDAVQIREQIAVQTLQHQVAIKQTELLREQHAKDRQVFDYRSTRFTNATLYQWMISQLSEVYLQAYDAVFSVCQGAEAAWQVELGVFDSEYVQSGGWSGPHQGLLAGESLKAALLRMDADYLSRNARRLEISKTISLKRLFGGAWAEKSATLRATGAIEFSFDQALFDQDYPGHYQRRCVSVAVSLPALLGPYEDVRAILTQRTNSLALQDNIEAVKFLHDNKQGSAEFVMSNVLPSQEVALSTGLNDLGIFTLRSGDEYFLPFEGTGAISTWRLEFPNKESQSGLLDSLNDVIVHLSYTAKSGAPDFSASVQKLNNDQ
jgi:hypothetical protein